MSIVDGIHCTGPCLKYIGQTSQVKSARILRYLVKYLKICSLVKSERVSSHVKYARSSNFRNNFKTTEDYEGYPVHFQNL